MKFNEFIRKSKLTKKEKQIEHWIENYDKAYPKIKIIPVADALEIEHNNFHIKKFKEKYPFYDRVIELNNGSFEEEEIRLGIVEEIIKYLEIVYQNGNILIQNGSYQSISKKDYSTEKKSILQDFNMIIFEAVLFNKIKELKRIYKQNKIEKESVIGSSIHNNTKPISANVSGIEIDSNNLLKTNTILKIDENKFFEKLKLNGLINERFEWVGLGDAYGSIKTQLNFLILLLENERKLISNLGDQAYLDFFGNKLTDFKPTTKQYFGKLRGEFFVNKKEFDKEHNYYDCYSRLKELLF
jgi:hypothetical protein